MKKILTLLILSACIVTTLQDQGISQQLSGRDIAVLLDERPNGNDRTMEMIMTLINRRGQTRVREMISYSKDYGKDTKTLFFFREPADVKGVGFLTWDYSLASREDDKWLYLPALRKEKRISGSSKNDSFMGSDLTYDDMGKRSVDDDTHTLLREEQYEGHPCWVIESVPKDKNHNYSKIISWVSKDALVKVRGEFYDRQRKLLKKLEATDVRQQSGFWVVFKTEVENVQDSHKTVFELKNVKFDTGLSDSFFQVATLKRGTLR